MLFDFIKNLYQRFYPFGSLIFINALDFIKKEKEYVSFGILVLQLIIAILTIRKLLKDIKK